MARNIPSDEITWEDVRFSKKKESISKFFLLAVLALSLLSSGLYLLLVRRTAVVAVKKQTADEVGLFIKKRMPVPTKGKNSFCEIVSQIDALQSVQFDASSRSQCLSE